MTESESLTNLSSNHVVINNAKAANNAESKQRSASFYSFLQTVEPAFSHFKERMKGEKGVNAKVTNYVEKKILPNTPAGFDLKTTVFVKWINKKKNFQIVSGKTLTAEIKNRLKEIYQCRKRVENNEKAKSSRIILDERPAKCLEKSSKGNRGEISQLNPALFEAMLEKKDEYFLALPAKGRISRGEDCKRLAIRKELVKNLQVDGFTFIEMVEGNVTQLSDDEAEKWIGTIYQNSTKYASTLEIVKPEDKGFKLFSPEEDKQIIDFINIQKEMNGEITILQIPFDELVAQMPDRNRASVMARTRSLFDENFDLIQHRDNEGKEWTEEEDRILFNVKNGTEHVDIKALSVELKRSEGGVKKRMKDMTFDASGKRVKRSDVTSTILTDVEKSKQYLDNARKKPNSEISERSQVMGCVEHGYKGSHEGYCRGVDLKEQQLFGMRVRGPSLHQAAATVGSGPRPSPHSLTGKRKKRYTAPEASHLCKNARCVNPKHVKWESTKENMRRNNCVGLVKFNINGRVITARAKECKCNGRCLDYVTVK